MMRKMPQEEIKETRTKMTGVRSWGKHGDARPLTQWRAISCTTVGGNESRRDKRQGCRKAYRFDGRKEDIFNLLVLFSL